MSIELYQDLHAIPPYDDDIRLCGYPEPVQNLRDMIKYSDALILSTPEYGRSFSGVLKNTINWASRPPEQLLDGKAALVMGVTSGPLGTAFANYHLRQVLSVLNVFVLPGRAVLVGSAASKFDTEDHLTDDATREFLAKYPVELKRLALLLRHKQEC